MVITEPFYHESSRVVLKLVFPVWRTTFHTVEKSPNQVSYNWIEFFKIGEISGFLTSVSQCIKWDLFEGFSNSVWGLLSTMLATFYGSSRWRWRYRNVHTVQAKVSQRQIPHDITAEHTLFPKANALEEAFKILDFLKIHFFSYKFIVRNSHISHQK